MRIIDNNEGIVDNKINSYCDSIRKAKRDRNLESVEWIENNCYIDGNRLSFEALGPKMKLGVKDEMPVKIFRPYIFQYIKDDAPMVSVIKPRQSEITVTTINKALYKAIVKKIKIGHFFPSDGIADAVSIEKIRTAIEGSPQIFPYMLSMAVRRYMFTTGGIYTVNGVLSKAAGRAPSRDWNIYDEYDSMPESIIPVLRGMLKHSAHHLESFISTATVPGVGIDGHVSTGCEWEWDVKCPKCKRNQIKSDGSPGFEFPDNIINFFEITDLRQDDPDYQKKTSESYIGCRYCGEYIDRNSQFYLNTSRWIAKRPHVANMHSSYRMVAPMFGWSTGRSIIEDYHNLSIRGYESQFFNEDWGIAHIKGGQRLEEIELQALEMRYDVPMRRGPLLTSVSMGIDWGELESWVIFRGKVSGLDIPCSILNVIRIDREYMLAHDIDPRPENHVKAVFQLIEAMKPEIIINDANGIGIDRHSAIIDKYPGRTWGAFFDTQEKNKQIEQSKMLNPVWNEAQHKVTFPKTKMVKNIIREIRTKQVSMPHMTNRSVLMNFITHHMNLGIQSRYDTAHDREYQIVVKFGPDHLFDADMYAKIGFNKITGGSSGGTAGVA